MSLKVAPNQVYPCLSADTADGLGRETLGHNKTSSTQDADFAKYRGVPLSPRTISDLKDWKSCFNRARQTIEEHFEKRVSQLFIQAVVCYRSGYVFRKGKTIHQGLEAHHLPIDDQAKQKLAAAHHATVPNLYAYCEETKEEKVFLYRSGIYDESNATADVLEPVNQADSALDWTDPNNSLREKTVGLLNRAAKRELTPEEVSKKFVKKVLKTIDGALEKAKKTEVKDVLQLYRNKAQDLTSYVRCPENIDRWLHIDLDDPLLEAAKSTVERLKQGAEVDREDILQLIKSKIDELPPVIHHQRHQGNDYRAPNHFYDLFFLQLLEKFTPEDVQLIEEATDIQSESLIAKAKTFKKRQQADQILSDNAQKIDGLVADLQPLLATLKGNAEGNHQLTALSPEKKVSLRPGIRRLRYEMIQKDQEAQSVIKSHIENILHQIQNASRAHHLEVFLHCSILATAPNEKTRQMFCKLLSISGAEIERRVMEIQVNSSAHKALEYFGQYISLTARNPLELSPQAAEKQIKDLAAQIKSRCNTDNFVEILLYRRLFNLADTDERKALLTKVIGRTEKDIDQTIANAIAERKKPLTAKTVIEGQSAKIQEIMTVAMEAVQKLKESTYKFRHELMVELRQAHGMSQKHFKAIYKQKFPTSPMSDGTMSYLENGHKPIDETIISQLSSIFGVNKELFNPSTFANEFMD